MFSALHAEYDFDHDYDGCRLCTLVRRNRQRYPAYAVSCQPQSHAATTHDPSLMTGVPAPVPVSSLRTTRQPRRHGRATLALRINHTREAYWNKRCKFQTRRSPSAWIGNVAASKRADLQKGWSRSLGIGGGVVTGTRAFAGRSSFFLSRNF
jgi:hypothetical protein